MRYPFFGFGYLYSMILNESSKWDEPVRKMVKDIVNIIKLDDTGSWLLPSDISDDNEYQFYDVPGVQIYFDWDYDYNIDSPYYLNGDYDGETDTMNVILYINPKNFPQSMYDIVADLNDIVRHEYEHHMQFLGLRPDEEYSDLPLSKQPKSYKYYLQKHEIPAVLQGFRRVMKLKNQPLDVVMDDWYSRTFTEKGMPKKSYEKLKTELKNEYEKRYGKKST